MNVNDVVCVGAEPIAVLDYLAVEQTDPDVFAAIAHGLKAGAEQAGVEIPGGEVAVLPELIRGHPVADGLRPHRAPASARSRSTRSSPARRARPATR